VLAQNAATGTRPAVLDIRASGEHRMASGDTTDSARQLAIVDAQRKLWAEAATQLQRRADVKALGFTPVHIEAYVPVVLGIEEPPSRALPAQGVMRVPMRAQLNADEAVRRMASLRKDEDASYDLVIAWSGMQQLHQRLADQTRRRASLSSSEAGAIVQEQVQTITRLQAKHLAARASAALARTEPSAVGGRAPSSEGRERARQLANAALALAPESPDAHAVMGDILIDASEPEAAEAEYRQALRGNGESSAMHTKLAEALRLQGKIDEAIAELREAIRLEPGSSRAYNGLGLALRGKRQETEAIAAYREAVRLEPDLADAHNGLAVALAGQGKLDEAVAEFREIVRIDPDSAIGYYNLAYALADLDRDVESAAALREVIRINPNHYNARFNLGELFRLEGKYDESAKQFREYLRLAPDVPQNRRNIERAKGYVEKFEDP
jgi:tetratricopeptide (TPR) repeat protein